ncbi:uncharacterized protein VNE69_01360 [Vairimorpha necatrix]|uniref:Membrane protein n=1 Tax=Vairimorpha necatrix TaxID=6039 RepID=A0AAX4J928_9MICR
MSLLLKLFLTANLIKASGYGMNPLYKFFKINNMGYVCHLLSNFLGYTNISEEDIQKHAELVWEITTKNEVFKNMIRDKKYIKDLQKMKTAYLKYILKVTFKTDWREPLEFIVLNEAERLFTYNMLWVALDSHNMYNSCYNNVIYNMIPIEESVRNIIYQNICYKQIGKDKLPLVILKKCRGFTSFYDFCYDFDDRVKPLKNLKINQEEVLGAICNNDTYEFKDVFVPNVDNFTELCNTEYNTDPEIAEIVTKFCSYQKSTLNVEIVEDIKDFTNIKNNSETENIEKTPDLYNFKSLVKN